MSIRRIRVFPDPILRKKCRVVRRVDDKIRELAYDMIETMDAASGVGLAANQVGALQRVVTLHLPGDEDAIILINPEIRDTEGEREIIEGCLSFPGYEGMVKRSVSVKARWLDENGSKMKVTTEDLFAQVLEHEVDHLNGILYIDHLLEHEKLDAAGTHVEEGEPHMHDIEVEVHADHSDDDEVEPQESDIEVVHTTIKFNDLYSESLVDQMHYDLRKAGYALPPSESKAGRRVESDDPHLDGGVILDPEHKH
ncbi:MAG: peptide deformylase [Dehalococcoidia bacterium]|nr:peptide deformylase [Dehalococcoidia bacterium]